MKTIGLLVVVRAPPSSRECAPLWMAPPHHLVSRKSDSVEPRMRASGYHPGLAAVGLVRLHNDESSIKR